MKISILLIGIFGATLCDASALHDAIRARFKGRARATAAGLPLVVRECTKASSENGTTTASCTSSTKRVVIDQNWLWYTTDPESSSSCDLSSGGDLSACELVQPTSYATTYGITTSDDELYLPYQSPTGGTGSRLYLMDSDSSYTEFSMLNKEISFDVDLASLSCGFNAAVYFVEMDADGGKSSGTQGPAFGTGYCDAQCPSDQKTTTTGTANVNAEHVCCNEMDLWEANTKATAMTPHPCAVDGSPLVGPYACDGSECDSSSTSGVCDGSGCDFNSYRNGDTTFYGPGSSFAVDSTKTMTVTTQFHADAAGKLTEIVQFYTVEGVTIDRRSVTFVGGETFNTTTSEYCSTANKAYGGSAFDYDRLSVMGTSLERGMVLVMSLWNDPTSHMLWLDGTLGSGDGSVRGPCGTTDDSEDSASDAAAGVTYSKLAYGDIGSTTLGN